MTVNYVALRSAEPDTDCLCLLPEEFLRRRQVVPISRDKRNRLIVAMVNPNDIATLDEIKMRMTGTFIKPVVCTSDDFDDFMNKAYAQIIGGSGLGELDRQASDAPIVLLANQILAKAIRSDTVEIKFETTPDSLHVIYVSKNGPPYVDRRLPHLIAPALFARFKIMAKLDTAAATPQRGTAEISCQGKDFTITVWSAPNENDETMILEISPGTLSS